MSHSRIWGCCHQVCHVAAGSGEFSPPKINTTASVHIKLIKIFVRFVLERRETERERERETRGPKRSFFCNDLDERCGGGLQGEEESVVTGETLGRESQHSLLPRRGGREQRGH